MRATFDRREHVFTFHDVSVEDFTVFTEAVSKYSAFTNAVRENIPELSKAPAISDSSKLDKELRRIIDDLEIKTKEVL